MTTSVSRDRFWYGYVGGSAIAVLLAFTLVSCNPRPTYGPAYPVVVQ